MSELLRRIAALHDERGQLYQRRDWTDADRARVHDLNEQIDLLYRQRRAELCGADVRSVPVQLPRFGMVGRRKHHESS